MFHMKNPTQIRKAKATTIIQIEKPMFHVKHWLCFTESRFCKTTVQNHTVADYICSGH